MTKAKKTTGLCTICGDASNPKGNVFTIVRTYEFILEGAPRYREQAPDTEWVKVCNNCQFPHPYHRRESAKRKRFNSLIDELLASEE